MTLGDPSMTAVEIGVGESRTRDTYGGAATGCPKGIVSTTRANAQGGALLPKVPTNPGEEFDAAPESKKAHGMRGLRLGCR